MINRKIHLYIFIFLLLPIISRAQDSTASTDNSVNHWSFGVQLESSYPYIMGKSSNLISNEIGFSFGLEIGFKNIFTRANIGGMDGKVKNSFTISDEWPKNLPLNVSQILFYFGYKINISNQLIIKPILSIMELNFRTDDKVKEFTNIDRELELNYYGSSIGISYVLYPFNSFINHLELEFVFSFYKPFNSYKKKIFPNNALNLTLGILIFPKNYF